MRVSTTRMYATMPKSYKVYLRHAPFVLRMIALALLVVVLARPQSTDSWQSSEVEGIDIMLAMDVSTSMLAEDLKPNRLEAAKQVAADFINGRPNDNIGLTVFAGQSFTQSPLTVDHAVLLNLFNSVSCSMATNGIIEDGTAIGNGLATAINRLRESEAKSKVIILLTDGVNNRGEIAPLMAAGIAADMGVKVYTIGVGTRGKAPYPAVDMFGNMTFQMMDVEIDEETLQAIADQTGGRYFRATDRQKLKEIYDEINTLEKSEVEVTDLTIYHEQFVALLLLAIALLAAEMLIEKLVLKRIP